MKRRNTTLIGKDRLDCRRSLCNLPSIAKLLQRAAEALFEFVFSGCNRLDGKRRWANCDEETKIGFRREAAAL